MQSLAEAMVNLTSWDSSQIREGFLDLTEGIGEIPLVWTAVTLQGYSEGRRI